MYCVGKGDICFACDLNIQEGNGFVVLLLDGEFDEWVLAVQVEEEFLSQRLGRRSAFSMVSSSKLFHEQIRYDRG